MYSITDYPIIPTFDISCKQKLVLDILNIVALTKYYNEIKEYLLQQKVLRYGSLYHRQIMTKTQCSR